MYSFPSIFLYVFLFLLKNLLSKLRQKHYPSIICSLPQPKPRYNDNTQQASTFIRVLSQVDFANQARTSTAAILTLFIKQMQYFTRYIFPPQHFYRCFKISRFCFYFDCFLSDSIFLFHYVVCENHFVVYSIFNNCMKGLSV